MGTGDRIQMMGIRKKCFDRELTNVSKVVLFLPRTSLTLRDEISSTARTWALNCVRQISSAEIDKSLVRSSFRGRNSDCTSAGIPEVWEPAARRRAVPTAKNVQSCALP